MHGFKNKEDALALKQLAKERLYSPQRPDILQSIPDRSYKSKAWLAIVSSLVTAAGTNSLGTGSVYLKKRNKIIEEPSNPDGLEIVDVLDQYGVEVEKTVYNRHKLPYPVGTQVWVQQDVFGDLYIISVTTSILTGQLTTDVVAGSTGNADLYDSSGLVDLELNVEVADAPQFIPTGKKLETDTWVRIFIGDGGAYHLLTTSECAVDA